jgi:ATP/maltotriose-dependent transcriptional regulator MalT
VRVGRGVVVAHPLLRCVVVARSAAADRRRVHLALAAVVPDAATRAWQLALAATGPDDAVADALAAAGREGPQAGAGAALARAAELTTDPTLAARRRLDAARAFAAGGHPDQALALLGAAEEAVTPGGDRLLAADLRRLRSRIELRRGGPAGVHAALAAEAQAVRDLDPARAAWLLVEAAAVHLAAGDHEALLEEATAAGLLAGEDPDGALGLLARVLVAGAHAGRGDDEAAEAVLGPLVGRLLEADLAEGPAEAAALAGHLAVWAGRWDRAAALLDRLVAAARGAGAVAELIHPLAVHALLDLRRGRWTSALADAGESARLARATGNRGLLAFSAGVLACVEAVHGRSDDAHAHAREALALTEAFEGSATACYALHALALDALGRGDAELGAEWLTRLERAAAAATLGRAVVPFGADRVEALARAGRPEVAHEALEHFADGQGGGHWAPAALARCRGLLADGGEFEDHFETALALHARDGQPWEKARTQLCYGERLRRERRRADARELLAEALVTFERLGSEPWAERARIELRATGTAAAAPELAQEPTAAAVAAAGLDDLTAHELQIARLVAYGMTNREVGAKLFLSPKTIEYHLSAIYRKLELRSRTQLAKLMASELVPAG